MNTHPLRARRGFLLLVAALFGSAAANADQDPLPSWPASDNRTAIVDFVERVTNPDSDGYVPPAERIAVFDNDGTLWVEQPMYTQLAFIIDRVEELAPQHPEWQTEQPFKGVLEGNLDAISASGKEGLFKLLGATHGGMSRDEFTRITTDWLNATTHPRFKRPYTTLTYQPMVELLAYLRANGFKTYIVSGGGVAFMRPWTEAAYGIPPEQVMGTRFKLKLSEQDGKPIIERLAEIDVINDKAVKPLTIANQIGRRPILAVGNSDGDFAMLDWTTSGDGARLGILIHHDDAAREYAYDRDSHFGRLDKGLDHASAANWLLISMQNDWSTVFPPHAEPLNNPAAASAQQ